MSIMGDTTFWFLIDRIGEIGRMHSFVSVPDCTVKREKSVCAQSNNNYIRFSLPLSFCLILRNRIAFSSRTQLPKRQIACTRSIHSIAIRISLAPRRRMRLSAWENPMNMKKKLSTKSRIAIRRCIYSSEADWRRHPPNECRQQQCWSGSGGGNSNTSAAMLVAIHVCSQFCFNRCFAWVDNKFVLRPHQLKSASDGIDRTSI